MNTVSLKSLVTPIEQKAGGNNFPVLSITAGIGFVSQKEKFGKNIAGAQYSKYIVIKQGDFSYNKGNSKTYPHGCIYCLENYDSAAVPNVFYSFRFTSEYAFPQYYKYIFESSFLNQQLRKLVNSGVRDDGLLNLYEKDFYSCLVPCPPLEEQRRIAEILGCCDRVIALKKELIAEKKKQKKALMQKLLNPDSGFRLPGFSGEWKTVKLKEVCDINTSSLSENTNPDKSFYYLDLATVDKGKIVNEPAFVTFGNAPCRARRLFKKGDILFSTVRPYLCGFLFADFVADDYVASTGFAILTPQIGNMIGKLLYHHLFSDNIILQTQNLLSGTNYPALNSYDVENLYIDIPKDIKEQQAIADILSAADKEIDLLEQELVQQEQKKKSLMQLLLTGIVRV